MILLLTGCWLLLTLPIREKDPIDTSWWTDVDTDSDSDADTDTDPIYFDPFVWGLDFEGGWDGEELVSYGIGGDIEQYPYVELTLYEEEWFDSMSDANKCISLFRVDMVREDDLGWPGQIWWGAEVELTWVENASVDECDNLNPMQWGSNTPDEALENYRLGLGLAPLSPDMEQALRDAVNSSGGNWSQDYAPYLVGYYLADSTAGSFYGMELGWGSFNYVDDDGAMVYGDDGNPLTYEIQQLSEAPAHSLLQGYSYFLQYVDGTLIP